MANQPKKKVAEASAHNRKSVNPDVQAHGTKDKTPKPRNTKQNARTAEARAKARETWKADHRHTAARSKIGNITPDTREEDLADIRYGKPSEFRPVMIEQVRKLCELGATDSEIANFFGVTRSAILYWKMYNTHFLEAMRAGKQYADERVERSLFARAVGFEHPAVKIFYDHKSGQVIEHEYNEIYAPDVDAAKFWLINRRPEQWRLHREAAVSDPTEAAEIAQMAMAKAMATTVRAAEGVAPNAKVKAT